MSRPLTEQDLREMIRITENDVIDAVEDIERDMCRFKSAINRKDRLNRQLRDLLKAREPR